MQNKGEAPAPKSWKKTQHMPHTLKEEINSFLRIVGLVTLSLDKAMSNMEKLERVLVGRLLGRRLPFLLFRNELHRKW